MEFKMADKYYRMIHSYEKLKRVSTNTGNSISLSDGKEAAEDFFNHCYHFKDWLIKEYPNLKQVTETYISNSWALSVAADYCNSFKHGGLDRTPRTGHQLDAVNQHTRMDITPRGFVCSAQVEIKVGGKNHRAFDLATDCIRAWKKFMRANNVKIPPP